MPSGLPESAKWTPSPPLILSQKNEKNFPKCLQESEKVRNFASKMQNDGKVANFLPRGAPHERRKEKARRKRIDCINIY